MSEHKKSLKVAGEEVMRFSVGTPKVEKVIKISIPIEYTIGDDHEQGMFKLEIDRTHADYETIVGIFMSHSATWVNEIELTAEDLSKLPTIDEAIEKYLHKLFKEWYR